MTANQDLIFTQMPIHGAYVIESKKKNDNRGFFARAWCKRELKAHGLEVEISQINFSLNYMAGTLRGMHFQEKPFEEVKLVRCIQGALYDVIIDLREDSPTYLKWHAVELSGENARSVYIPPNCAHGYQTLLDNTQVIYLESQFYTPEYERGLMYNDQQFNIPWPLEVTNISKKDRNWPRFFPNPRD